MADPISWEVAERLAVRVADRRPPPPSYERQALEADFAELTEQAEELVAAETGLRSLAGPARARVTDRAGWVRANVASFRRLITPVAEKLAASHRVPTKVGPVTLAMPAGATRTITGGQVGLLLGWMSTRVLGQYDQLLIEDDHPEDQDIVYYVGPNIAALEQRFGFPPREFRLWIALHEVTHRAQFTGVPWMRAHFLSLVSSTLGSIDADPKRLVEALRRAVDQIRSGRNPLDEGGLVTLLATPDQFQAIRQVSGLMSLLEGHGDVTMDRAAADRIPNADRFSRALRERRRQRGAAKVMSSLLGLDAKLRQYQQGEEFIASVEGAGGPDLLARVWEGPEWLPSWDEIHEPETWIARAGAPPVAVGS
ncbi:MAG: zinc-dependent metalloprotease [Acidimicrobiales bacterium]